MRIAISGSHGTGKSTLIEAFLKRRPDYAHEPEAFESLADDVDLTFEEGPTEEGMALLLRHAIDSVARRRRDESVVFERSPVDYIAYAAASERTWSKAGVSRFLAEYAPVVRASIEDLDLIALISVDSKGPGARAGEDPRFRRRVDRELKRALLDDDHGLLGGPRSPRVIELPAATARQLATLEDLIAGA